MTALFCVIIKGIMTDTGRGWKMGDNIFLKNSKKPELSDYMNFNVQGRGNLVHIPQELRIRSRGTERCSASN